MTSYDDLKRNIKNCRFCEEKFGFLPHPVVFGNENSKIFQISQAPSSSVHMTGKPFDDLSGKRLKYSWYQVTDEIFYNPDNFYITALGHCYPGKTASGGDKQPPKICSEKWLGKELKMVCNDIYVLIGKYNKIKSVIYLVKDIFAINFGYVGAAGRFHASKEGIGIYFADIIFAVAYQHVNTAIVKSKQICDLFAHCL